MTNAKDIEAQLRRMPKSSVGDVVTSTGAQSKVILLVGVAFQLVSLVFYGVSLIVIRPERWEQAAAIVSCFAPLPLMVGGLLAVWVFAQTRKCRRLAGGEYYVHWRYEPEQWAAHCDHSASKLRLVLPIIGLCGAGVGLVLALLVHLDDERLFYGTLWTHYGLCIGLGSAIGTLVGWFCVYCGNITQSIKQNRTAHSIIGPLGIYITGEFWPTSTLSQSLLSAAIQPDDAHVLFTFRIRTKNGNNDVPVPIPIPPGQQQVAIALVELIESELP
ncbi:MAG: hypothetical protein AAGD11_17525 [Planctomycetota bacterium]